MDLSEWFTAQLQPGADGFVWGMQQVPEERWYATPPGPRGGLGVWVAARHAFHLLYYEREVALPAMRHWLGGPSPEFDAYHHDDEDVAWQRAPDLARVLHEFRAGRAAQIALLPRIGQALWREGRETGWGQVTLRWIVSKTYQHTAEHLNDVLRIALFWDFVEADLQRQRETEGTPLA